MSLADKIRKADQQQNDIEPLLQNDKAPSIHGEQAARRRAVTDLIFFAGVNDVARCQQIVKTWGIRVGEEWCSDYDKRTPLHVACAEGAYSTTEWLMEQGARVNALDRFKQTPLQEAVLNDHVELIRIVKQKGGQVWEDDKLVGLESSRYKNLRTVSDFGIDADWEIDPQEITLLEMIGEGEFGQVFRGNWHGTDVAVKVLKRADDIAIGDFRTELSVLSKVHHPHAVQFLGAVTKQQPFMMVTELMACSVHWAARQVYAMTLPRLVKVALDFARGMAYLHVHPPQIIHRDLKPANLMVGGNLMTRKKDLVYNSGVVKIADFGLSKTLQGKSSHLTDRYTLTGETGSYRYMAPEVFRHEPYNFKVDVYSFAMIIYELFFQQQPFAERGAIEAAQVAALQHLRPYLPIANDEPRKLLFSLIQRCWDPEPDKRPDFQEIIKELLKVQQLIGKQPENKPKSCSCCVQ